jgi:hypothetical protein
MNNSIVDKILSEVCLDDRVVNGTFDIEDHNHILVLKEYLENKNIPEDMVLEFVNLVVEKGKHPERQAYNKNGLLVTFPTPAYKARAIAKGTHFEKKPAAATNLFAAPAGGQQAPAGPAPAGSDIAEPSPMDAQQSTLPSSDTTQAQTPPAQPETPEPGTPGTPAPSGGGGGGGVTPTQPPAQGELPATPVVQPPAAPNVAPTPITAPSTVTVQKTPQQVAAEKEAIKQMLDSGDTLPTVAGVGGVGITEELKKLIDVARMMNLNEAVKFLSAHI